MIARLAGFIALFYAIGFLLFAVTLPTPVGHLRTDAVLVPTGGPGRIARGLEVLRDGDARRMFVSGVDREVTANEFASEFGVRSREMRCCVTLGYLAVDTRSNAGEAAQWMQTNDVRTVRLVTTDWHMRRAAAELRNSLPATVRVIEDAVPSNPALGQLFLEYNKLLAAVATRGWWDGGP
ncbi:YdcF family protein [Qipengyuania sediminis]|uniref:YdcF family protein n=1 Tax=Qipengyuania sediminis TaxID=1532023 RepID=UPI00105A492B|nr:YdcF family protein [Qipengyuania sediminis]